MKLIDRDALVAEIEKRLHANGAFDEVGDESWAEDVGMCNAYKSILSFIDTLEVKEVKLPNPRFPHLNNIVDKVFGTGNLESLEYEEAEQLVLLAKEELLKDLEVKEKEISKNEAQKIIGLANMLEETRQA